MEKNEKEALLDMKAFIEFAIEEDLRFSMVLGTIGHDLNGLYENRKGFLPRTHGYFKRCAYCGEPMYTTVRAHHHTENGLDVTEKKS